MAPSSSLRHGFSAFRVRTAGLVATALALAMQSQRAFVGTSALPRLLPSDGVSGREPAVSMAIWRPTARVYYLKSATWIKRIRANRKKRRGRHGRIIEWTGGPGQAAIEVPKPAWKPMGEASEDPQELLDQIYNSQKAVQLLEFLESAVSSPSFDEYHVVAAFVKLGQMRAGLREEERLELPQRIPFNTFVARAAELLESSKPPLMTGLESDEVLSAVAARNKGLSPAKVADMFEALGVYAKELPSHIVRALCEPLSRHAVAAAPSMQHKHVGLVVWAVAQLLNKAPNLVDDVLPLVMASNRLYYARLMLPKTSPQDTSRLELGILKLRRDVAYLREVLPAKPPLQKVEIPRDKFERLKA